MRLFPNILIFIFFLGTSFCNAEVVYYKDGRVLKGKINYRSSKSIWLEIEFGSLGVGIDQIDKITNDDGSISKYDLKGLSNQAEEHIKEGNYGEAVELYGVLLETFPDNEQIHYLRGILNHKIGRLSEALRDYSFLIEHKVADAEIYNNLGAIYTKQKKYGEAKEWFAMAIQKNPNFIEAHNNLAVLFLEKSDLINAMDEYKKIISLEPNNTEALYNLGLLYAKEGNYDLAKKQWEKILKIQPQDDDAKNSLEYIKLISNESQKK